MAVGNHANLFQRYHALLDHAVNFREQFGNPFRLIHDLNDDGQIFGQAQNLAVCIRLSAPKPMTPRSTVAPAKPFLRAR